MSRLDRIEADYSAIDTLEKAELAVEAGELIAMLMVSEDFGGSRRPENILYVPPSIADVKERIDWEEIRPIILSGKSVEYHVHPSYAGRCMVPTDITVTATSPEPLARHIRIWWPA
jgi:hypothetical protein